MFASLKNKIKEETGKDPTQQGSNNFKDRRSTDADRSSSGHGLDSDGSGTESSAYALASQRISPPIVGIPDGHSLTYKSNFRIQDEGDSVTTKCSNGDHTSVVDADVCNDVTDREVSRGEQEQMGDHLDSATLSTPTIEDPIPPADLLGFRIQEAARTKQLAAAEMKLRRLEDQLLKARKDVAESNNVCVQLNVALTEERNASALVSHEASILRAELRELHLSLEREVREKDVVLLRNAQLNQEVEMSKQDLRLNQVDTADLQSRLTSLEEALVAKESSLLRQVRENEELTRRVGELEFELTNHNATLGREDELRKTIGVLEEQLAEKVKSIRVLQQHLGDLKKTLQRELKQNGDDASNLAVDGGAASTPSAETDVNFKYLKHVIMKFLTSREYEAQHLTRAVSTLLKFSPEEERLLRETLEYKMSWFGTRPQLGFGQSSKTIPPS